MRLSVKLSCVAVALCVTGCGGGESEADKAAEAATAYYTALSSGNAAAMCEALSVVGKESLKTDVSKLAGGTICTKAAARASQVAAAFVGAGKLKQLAESKPTNVTVEGDAANLQVGTQAVSLAKEPDGWKVASANQGADPEYRMLPDMPGDQRPRIEGKWRVIYTGDDPTRTTWRMKPACEIGACDFSAKSSLGYWFKMNLDKSVGDYTLNKTTRENCELTDGTILAKDGFKYSDKWSVQVRRAMFSEGQLIATELRGDRVEVSTPTQSAAAKGCYAERERSKVRFVRLNPPSGSPVSVSN